MSGAGARTSGPPERAAEGSAFSETTLFRWIRQFEVDEGRREWASTGEREELAQLRRDKRRLEQENETLRRAAACFAKEALPK